MVLDSSKYKKALTATILLTLTIALIPIALHDIRVNAAGLTVTLSPSGTVLANYNSSVNFVATAVNGTTPYKYQWFFTFTNGTQVEITSAENSTSWLTYNIVQNGNYMVRVNVTDSVDATAFASAIIRLNTKLEIRPSDNTFYANQTSLGTDFIVNATVVNVADFQNWQIGVQWDPNVLDFVNVTLPVDNVFAGHNPIPGGPDFPEPGYFTYGATYVNFPEYWTFNGTGTLCQIAWRINATPIGSPPFTTSLTFMNIPSDTFLLNGAGFDITFTAVSGTFTYEDLLSVALNPSGTIAVDYGQTVLFTATAADGKPPYTYQWYFKYPNGTEIEVTAAYNSTTWTSYPLLVTGNHKVTAKVTDNLGAVANASATIQLRILTLTITPQTASVNAGGDITFNATIFGGIPPYKVQWLRNGLEEMAFRNMTLVMINFPSAGIDTIMVNVTDTSHAGAQKFVQVNVYATPTTFVNVVSATGTGTFYSNATGVGGVGDAVTFNVTVAGVTDLANWQVKLTWNPTLLNYSSVSLPDDNVFSGSGKSLIAAGPDVGTGSLFYGVSYINGDPGTPDYWSFNGSGTLFQVQFQMMTQPTPQNSSSIALIDQYLPTGTVMLNGASQANIPFIVNNGTCTYVLVSPVAHQLFGYTFWTYTNTSIIANDTDYMPMPEAWIDILNITGAPGTGAYINFTLPKALIKLLNPTDVWVVKLDGVDVTSQATITQDTNNTYIYLEFTFVDTHVVVRADGTWMVPEATQLLIIALLMSSLIVVILAKAAPRKKWMKY